MPMGAQVTVNPVRPISCLFSIIIVLVFLSSSYNVLALEANKDSSIEALLKFKSSLANADPALSNWVPSQVPCMGNQANWNGILCFNGYVWGLQLENMNLKGQIDVNSLVPIRFLRTLSFMNNGFEGTMPDWRKLGALKALYLSNNQFSGQIPDDAFKGMASLKKVHMANNKFTGHIPSSIESPKLIELRLENNQFTGTIPQISSDNLKNINVSNNQLEGPIPAPLAKMDLSSFSGNKALCGKPLGSSCDPTIDPPIPPPDLEPSIPEADATNENKSSSSSSSSPARIAIIVVCVVVGLLIILLLLFVYLRSRKSPANLPVEMEDMPPTSSDENVAHVSVATTSSTTQTGTQRTSEPQAGKLSFVREDRHKFDLQDLMRASAEVLGSGNFGASYKAVLVDGEALVVKRFKKMNNVAKEDFHEHMRRLGRLAHPNLLPLVAYLYRKEEKLLVYDYVYNGSLATHLHGKHSPGLSWASRLKIIKGVAKGLAYLHKELPSLIVPHGHLKSSNVLLDNNFNPMLMDYTLGPVVNPTQVHQTLVAYKSPEYSHSGRTCKKTDVWCLGVLILETLTGKFVANYLAQNDTHYEPDLAGWINSAQVFDEEMDITTPRCRPEMDRLLQIGIACCQEDPNKRLDLDDALNQIEQVLEESSQYS